MCVRIFVILLLALCSAATNATAQNAVFCLKPWTIPDKWIERHNEQNYDLWTADDTFETVDSHGNPLSYPDKYIAPSAYSAGTGFTFPRDFGLRLTLKVGEPQDGMKSGWFYAIDIGTRAGGDAYRTAIATCQDTVVHIGESLQPLSGKLNGPTVQGVADLINLDPTATWNPATKAVENSCAPSSSCGAVSPRIVAIAVFDPAVFETSLINSGQPELVVTNVIGVFIDGVVGGEVTGYLVAYVGNLP